MVDMTKEELRKQALSFVDIDDVDDFLNEGKIFVNECREHDELLANHIQVFLEKLMTIIDYIKDEYVQTNEHDTYEE